MVHREYADRSPTSIASRTRSVESRARGAWCAIVTWLVIAMASPLFPGMALAQKVTDQTLHGDRGAELHKEALGKWMEGNDIAFYARQSIAACDENAVRQAIERLRALRGDLATVGQAIFEWADAALGLRNVIAGQIGAMTPGLASVTAANRINDAVTNGVIPNSPNYNLDHNFGLNVDRSDIMRLAKEVQTNLRAGTGQLAKIEKAIELQIDLAFITGLKRVLANFNRDLAALISELEQKWQEAQMKCRPRTATGTGGAVAAPGSDVGKKLQLVDQSTQKPLQGDVVKIPEDDKDSQEPPKTADGDGRVDVPPFKPGDLFIVDVPCHQKITIKGAELAAHSGVFVNGVELMALGGVLSLPRKPLKLSFPGYCSSITPDFVDQGIASVYEQRLDRSTLGGGGMAPYRVEEVGRDFTICTVYVDKYGPLAPPTQVADAAACAGLVPPPTVGDAPAQPAKPDAGPIAERDIPREGQGPAPSDPFVASQGSWRQSYGDQWWLKAIAWLKADGTTILPERATPVIVAVIDTGVDRYHPELLGATWRNEKEIPGNGKDDDGNGFIDDVNGWNFVDNNPDTSDNNGHGTVVAGIIAAAVDNGLGIAGVNPWARIMPLKATDYNNKGGSIALASAIVYAVDNGARVINLSVGGKRLSRAEQAAIDHANKKGVLVVVAAGNLGIDLVDFSPAGLRGTLVVSAFDTEGKRTVFSNWGQNIDIAAPGVDILSLRARKTDLLVFERKDYKRGTAIVRDRYYRVTGTSFAAPIVSGVASLIMSINPKLTADEVRRMIVQSSRDIDVPGKDQFTGYGALDAAAALAADPAQFVEAAISGVSVTKADGKTVVRVAGVADADRFKAAWIELGQGDTPADWKQVAGPLSAPVRGAVLADVATAAFRGAKEWTLRVVVEHANGKRREGRFKLTLG